MLSGPQVLADLWSEDFALHGKTCSAAEYTLLLIYAESFCWPNAVLLETFDILLLPDETSTYTESTYTYVRMAAMFDARTGCGQTCQTNYLADSICPVGFGCYLPTCGWLPGIVDLAGR